MPQAKQLKYRSNRASACDTLAQSQSLRRMRNSPGSSPAAKRPRPSSTGGSTSNNGRIDDGSRKPASNVEQYNYSSGKDLWESMADGKTEKGPPGQKGWHFYGVVASHTHARKSKGTDETVSNCSCLSPAPVTDRWPACML